MSLNRPQPNLPFAQFAAELTEHHGLRAEIDAAWRAPETELVPRLINLAALAPELRTRAKTLARSWIVALRAQPSGGLVQGLMREYALSSQEGVALMCLAEALLRIPDAPTRDALIADKIGGGDWRRHIGLSPSPFVNAATWGLMISGRLVSPADESGLASALTRLIARSGAPLIRAGVDTAMRVLGEQFVFGQTIGAALAKAPKLERLGFSYSYDMLGEAAATAEDAARYFSAYENALHAIGAAVAGRGLYDAPGLSIKLSALHPRYAPSQKARVMRELLPRLVSLTLLARRFNVGVNIDAEESERLDLSLDLLEALCRAPELAGWNGVGFVVQAYQKRSYPTLAFIIDLARQTKRRIMLRLVKGAYWDSEIKRAQVEGQADFPVFTRKIHTDICYIACARRLLEASDAIYPQFATHNALTTATLMAMAGAHKPGAYEFQCLHGMGEPLYTQIVGAAGSSAPCRIYAPVGTHETLLAYLVRRLLENGANTSFVNRIGDANLPVDALLEDPIDAARALSPQGAPHPGIAAPAQIFAPVRINSAGIDLANSQTLVQLRASFAATATRLWRAGGQGDALPIINPADAGDLVGRVRYADDSEIARAFAAAKAAWPQWRSTAPAARAECLARAADAFEAHAPELAALIGREAGKTLPNAFGDIREAVDFLRYYGAQIRTDFANATHQPRGIITCISPWNFPLAIFTGQIAAALAAGNCVIAKAAEETPLIAARAVEILHGAGIPAGALCLIAGDGAIGAKLVAHDEVAGVVFTGSTQVARLIQRNLAARLDPRGEPIPLIAETGGQNALIVDSSALTEQVLADVLVSAFDSAGQRCSALRVLCLQEDIADATLARLISAMGELRVGRPDALSSDIGPLISRVAQQKIQAVIDKRRAQGFRVSQARLGDDLPNGNYLAPTLIELNSVADLEGEVFGPVLHVLRFAREALPDLLAELNATGFGLTGGAHSRLDGAIDMICENLHVGNLYINRNIVGAVVGVQPFGGHGLSGTGPKAGGPLYLRRMLANAPDDWPSLPRGVPAPISQAFLDWLGAQGQAAVAQDFAAMSRDARLGASLDLDGPVGERNVYRLRPRGVVLCDFADEAAMLRAVASALFSGNRVRLAGAAAAKILASLSPALRKLIELAKPDEPIDAALTDQSAAALLRLAQEIARRPGPIANLYTSSAHGAAWPLDALLAEQSLSINTTAAGGNASLMMIG